MKNKKMKSGGLLTLAFLMAARQCDAGIGRFLAAGCSRMALEKR